MRPTRATAVLLAAGVLTAGAGATAALGSSKGKGKPSTKAAKVPSNVNIFSIGDWQTFDAQVYGTQSGYFTTGGYDFLTTLYNGKIVPYLATSWKVAGDNKSITFKLRKGVKCQDGAQVTPQVVVNSYSRLFTVTPKKGVSLTTDFGAGPYSMTANMRKWTVTLSVGTPFGGLLNGTAATEAAIICPAGLANPTALQTGWFGSGPYELVSAVHGAQVIIKRNPHWTWGPVINGKQITWKDLPKMQTWKVIADPSTVANNLLTGGLDVAYLSGPALTRLQHNKKFTITGSPVNFPMTMIFRFGPGHSTDDKPLRQALAALVNPTDFAKAALAGQGKLPPLVTSFVQPWEKCYDPKTQKAYKSTVGIGLAKAKAILQAAGYTGIGTKLTAPNGTPVTIRVLSSPAIYGEAGPYLQQTFSPLGANLILNDVPTTAQLSTDAFQGIEEVGVSYGTSLSNIPATSTIGYWIGNPPSANGLNLFGPPMTEDPTWTSLVEASEASAGCVNWYKTQMYAIQHAIMVPIVEYPEYIVAKKGLTVGASAGRYWPWGVR